MDIKDKQRIVVEFLLLGAYAGEEIMIRLWNVSGSAAHCRASVFRWASEVQCGNEQIQNVGRTGRSCRHETDAAIRSIRQEDPNTSLKIIA
jgi:hypothetical protein